MGPGLIQVLVEAIQRYCERTRRESMKRREFVKLAGGIGLTSYLPGGLSTHKSASGETTEELLRSQPEGSTYILEGYKRMILDYHFSEFNPTTLENANATAIVDTMTKLKIDSMLLYAKDHWGNCYFATKKFKRHRNVSQDLFGEVLDGLHQNNIKVTAYYSVGWDEYASRHNPDWILRDKEGKPCQLEYYKTHPYYARWTFLCINSPYRDYSLAELKEVISRYNFEALFLDIFGRFPWCYCRYCKALWRKRYGDEIPQEITPLQIARLLDFQKNVTFRRYYEAVHRILKANHKLIPTTHNAGLEYALDGYIASEIDPYGVNYYSSLQTKLWRARADGKEVLSIGHRTNGLFDFTLKPIPSLKWEAATGVSHNCALMFVDQPFWDGSLDPVTYDALGKAFEVVDDLMPHVKGTKPYAEILILSSEQSEALDQGNSTGAFSDPSRLLGERMDLEGAYKIFCDLHLPFDICTDTQVTSLDLSQYPVIVVPYSAYLTNKVGDRLRKYVEAGGTLFFTYRSAQWNDNAKAVAEPYFGLVRLGEDWDNQISFIRSKHPLGDTYLRVHEVAKIENGNDYDVLATLTDPALRVTPTEWVTHNVIPGKDTTSPTLIRGKVGRGVFIYSAFRLFKEHLQQGLGVYRRLIEKTLASEYQPRFQVHAPRVVEAIYNQLGDEVRITLINGTTNKPSGPGNKIDIDEIIPLHGISISARAQVTEAWDMRGRKLACSTEDGAQKIEVPVLRQYEVVHVRLKKVS